MKFTLFQEKKPEESWYYVLRGNCYTGMKNFDMAVFDFYKAVQMNPHEEHSRILLKKVLFDIGQYTGGIEGIMSISIHH